MPDQLTKAQKIDQAVKDMCTDPGRQFSKDDHAQRLFGVLKGTKFPKKVADLFIEVTMMSTPFTGAHSEDSYQALLKLIKMNGKIVDNLLHYISKMKDSEQTLTVLSFDAGPKSKKTRVSFKKQRALAKEELEKRGSPEYDIQHYLG